MKGLKVYLVDYAINLLRQCYEVFQVDVCHEDIQGMFHDRGAAALTTHTTTSKQWTTFTSAGGLAVSRDVEVWATTATVHMY